MRLLLAWLSISLRLIFLAVLMLLLFATVWTIKQISSFAEKERQALATSEIRQASYRETATAIGIDIEPVSMRAESGIVLLQHNPDSSTPEPAAESADTNPAAATPVPEELDLPRLLVPLDPAEGTWHSGTRVPTRVPEIRRDHKLINVILLGSDDELTEDSFIRTDTMILVSLNLETGTVSMLSLPRDLFVYIVHGKMGRLNTAFGLGEYLGWRPDGGFGLLRQTIFYNFGINVHYYARVNFSGFETIIDTLGGVDIAVDCAYRDYYPVNVLDSDPNKSTEYRWRTLPIGYYSFSGFDALWYARIRKYTDDFDRGRRQQQLLRSMWRKARSQGMASTVPRLWNDLSAIVDTNMSIDLILQFLPFVIDLDISKVENFTFKKNHHTLLWTTPNGAQVLLPQAPAVADLMQDFYTPPSPHQAAMAGPSIGVYNASGHEGWDIVATERLRWDGYNAIALGHLDNLNVYSSNQLTDNVATEKGSLVPGILRALNMMEEQVSRKPKADRRFDYEIIIGGDYESCTFGVLPLDG